MKNIKEFSCSKCNEVFTLSELNVKKKFAFEKETKMKLLVTYVECPNCGNKSYVQLDNDTTLEVVRELTGLMKKKIIAEKKGHDLKRKDNRRALELNKILNEARKNLLVLFNGKEMRLAEYYRKNAVENLDFIFKLEVKNEKESEKEQ